MVPILRLEDLFEQGDYLSKLLTNAVAEEVAERRKAGQAVDLGLLSRSHGPLEPADEREEALRAELELQANGKQVEANGAVDTLADGPVLQVWLQVVC